MPISKYDAYFGKKKGAAQETLDALVKRYGPDKGKRIFYGMVNKRRKGNALSKALKQS